MLCAGAAALRRTRDGLVDVDDLGAAVGVALVRLLARDQQPPAARRGLAQHVRLEPRLHLLQAAGLDAAVLLRAQCEGEIGYVIG